MEYRINTFDRTVMSLCAEVDDLKDQVKYWKAKYEEEVKQNTADAKSRIEESQKGIANALMFALSVQDNPDGSISIGATERKHLAENWL